MATFNNPSFIALSTNDILVLDLNNKRIRKIDAFENISTVVGSSSSNFSGGYIGTKANFQSLTAFSVYNKSILLTDSYSVRYVSSEGTIVVRTLFLIFLILLLLSQT